LIHLFIAALVATVSATVPAPRVVSVQIVVRDLDAERRFYTQALDFKDLGSARVAGGRIDRLALGEERLDLLNYDRTGSPISAKAHSNDRDFQHIAIIVSNMSRAWSQVKRFAIRKVSVAPQVLPSWNPAAGGIAAVYFRDPEGHPLELLHFPPGKGAQKWRAAAPLFLGIDHTAIAVADTASSTRFYQALGLAVRGQSNNYGIEQQRLSGVPGAHVEITAVRFANAPGVEFLHYVEPVRTQPRQSASAYDLIATRTIFIEPRAAAICKAVASIDRRADGCVVRDPDGHLIELRAP
jgi:catechol 2,3-dioxygenase-like lactoylglutathione lyase family enzyme